MRQVNSLLRSVAKLALSRRSAPHEPRVLDADAPAPHTTKPLHIATSALIIAKHHRAAVSVTDARETIQRLAATRSPRRADKELIEDLVSATGLELRELAEVTKAWLPW